MRLKYCDLLYSLGLFTLTYLCLSSQDKSDCTSTSISVCHTIHLSACLILSGLFWQFHQPPLSVCLSVLPWLCWQLLGLMPSQCSAPSWPLERYLHPLSQWTGNHSFSLSPPSIFFPIQKFFFFPHSFTRGIILSFLSIFFNRHRWSSCVRLTESGDWERNTKIFQPIISAYFPLSAYSFHAGSSHTLCLPATMYAERWRRLKLKLSLVS